MNGRMGGARSQLAFDKGDGVAIDFAINIWGTGDGMAFFLYDASSAENNFITAVKVARSATSTVPLGDSLVVYW